MQNINNIIVGSGSQKKFISQFRKSPNRYWENLFDAKDPYEGKYQLLSNKREKVGSNYLNDSKAFIEYSNDMDDIYKTIEILNPNKNRKILIVFDYIIDDMLISRKLHPIVTKLFIRGRKLNISLAFITYCYFPVLKILDYILHTILLWKFLRSKRFK